MISQVSDPDQKKIITVLLFSIFFSLYYYYVLQHCYFQGCIFFPFPPLGGGNFIKLLGCWGRKSSGEDWTKEEGKGNYEIIALKMQELCLNFPKKNSGKGVTPLSTPKKDKNRFALFFPWGRKSS